mmetsp:Transcript_25872/g.76485  ORF Transcript_25872/g.76485 Transcript_25872/m.76485 type:complete len:189 (-) Transcript_25872:416-982(-)
MSHALLRRGFGGGAGEPYSACKVYGMGRFIRSAALTNDGDVDMDMDVSSLGGKRGSANFPSFLPVYIYIGAQSVIRPTRDRIFVAVVSPFARGGPAICLLRSCVVRAPSRSFFSPDRTRKSGRNIFNARACVRKLLGSIFGSEGNRKEASFGRWWCAKRCQFLVHCGIYPSMKYVERGMNRCIFCDAK